MESHFSLLLNNITITIRLPNNNGCILLLFQNEMEKMHEHHLHECYKVQN